MALVLVAVTTLGWGGRPAAAAIETTTQATVRQLASPAKPEDVALPLRDALDAARYELEFEREARNAEALGKACLEITSLAGQLDDKALADAAASVVAACSDPTRISDDSAAIAIEDALRYRELTFDSAD